MNCRSIGTLQIKSFTDDIMFVEVDIGKEISSEEALTTRNDPF